MLQNWLILLPELSLLAYVLTALVVNRFRADKTPKTFFTLGKFFLLFSLFFTVIFYNKSAWPGVWQNTPFTTLFKIVIYLVALTWFYLSSKWFLTKNLSSCGFYIYAFLGILGFELLLSAATFWIPAVVVPLLCLLNWLLFKRHRDEETVSQTAGLYVFWSAFFCLLLWGGAFLLRYHLGSLSFAVVREHLGGGSLGVWEYAAVTMIVASLLFMMAAAPFHSWFVDMVTGAILPVCGYLTLLPPFAFLACLISLMAGVFAPFSAFMQPALLMFSGLSLLIGALSANGEPNLRRLFAFGTVYNLGFMLLSIVTFNHTAVLSAFAYTVIYILSMAGIYTVFLGLKSRNNYLTELDDISGLSNLKPYMSAALLVFMVSLIGIPPMLGFVGRLSVVNNLIVDERWSHVILLLVSLLFMGNAYLQVIRTVYFEPLKNSFDRTDKSIYICLFINLVLVIISLLNPGYLLHDAENILTGAFG